jgi:CRISPR-associated protein Csx3
VQASPQKDAPIGNRKGSTGAAGPLVPDFWVSKTAAEFAATTLSSASGLAAHITDAGALFAIRHGGTLISQSLPGPAEDGFFRLILRWRPAGGPSGWTPLVGPSVSCRRLGPRSIGWSGAAAWGISNRVTLTVHADLAAWAWHVHLKNDSGSRVEADVLLAQDLGLGDEGAVRNSEAFLSQYIDLLPVSDARFGWAILARQNLPMAGGRHPWLSIACVNGAAAYCTDGTQFFGTGHRLACEPEAVRAKSLPSKRLQYEAAMAGLQSRPVVLEPGGAAELTFVARFVPDHRAASSPSDLELLRGVLPAAWAQVAWAPGTSPAQGKAAAPSLFVAAPWLHGDRPRQRDWSEWFPGERRHEEFGADGSLQAFFSENSAHVVARDKEAMVARPHGHILRSGTWRWVDPEQFGTTCYAAGIFSAQAYLGNPTFARLLPVLRSALGIGRASGQRVFLRRSGTWHQLGLPSAFAMTTGDARWTYRLGAEVIEARVWCSSERSCAFLELHVREGAVLEEFLVTHTLALDTNEFDHPAEIRIHRDECWAECRLGVGSVAAGLSPETCFAIAAVHADGNIQIGDDGLLFKDGHSRGQPCLVLQSGKASRMGVILCGAHNGTDSLQAEVQAARKEWTHGPKPSAPPPPPVRLALPAPAIQGNGNDAEAAVSRVDEILPWFVHNAAIHFSAPHGLEQQGGAAWGVRDVCQGSVEWLIAAGELPLVRRTLEVVFAQQFSADGAWPQWFMHPPYQSILQAESHGDVCLWPVKALCDYLEASNDLEFLRWRTGYTDPQEHIRVGPAETLLQHCDRVIGQCEARFVPNTALINYGDGDWDDTLQPADPAMRTRMISSWTVALAFHTFRQLSCVLQRVGERERGARIDALLARMRVDFSERLMPGSVVAGFLITNPDGSTRPLLHPSDTVTGIRYRLLPMTRAVLAELFTAEEASRHMALVHTELLCPDGVRLMSEPAKYLGGCEHLFKRAETAANVGREIGLQYVHAHLRYAEAMAKVGEADRLWTALQVVNPVALAKVVGRAAPRQSNVYFSSSDADFADRYEAELRWPEVKSGTVRVRGGWRLYSSGPGIFVHKVRACLLGLRESFGEIVFDPVLPATLDGLVARATLCGRPVELRYRVKKGCFAPNAVSVNGTSLTGGRREANPYRAGGLCFREDVLKALLSPKDNVILVDL